MTEFLRDLASHVQGDVSIAPGTQQSGDGETSGDWISVDGICGAVHAIALIGASSEYSVYDISVNLREADDASGTNAQDIDGTSVKTVTLSSNSGGVNDKSMLVLTAKNRTKKFVQVQVAVNGTEASSGASPTVEIAACVFGQDADV